MVEQQRPQTRKNSFYLFSPPTPVADRSLVDKLRSRVRRKSIFFPTVYVTISRCQRGSVQAQGTYLQSNNYCFRVVRAHNNVYIYARFSASLVLIHNNFLFFFFHKKLNGQVFVRYTFNRVQFLFFFIVPYNLCEVVWRYDGRGFGGGGGGGGGCGGSSRLCRQ